MKFLKQNVIQGTIPELVPDSIVIVPDDWQFSEFTIPAGTQCWFDGKWLTCESAFEIFKKGSLLATFHQLEISFPTPYQVFFKNQDVNLKVCSECWKSPVGSVFTVFWELSIGSGYIKSAGWSDSGGDWVFHVHSELCKVAEDKLNSK